ncbi:hypothetical protein DFJ43DRAFT_1153786 [Lentinula guzmanii]|uniref:Uncharacterized protein n=1 Tax=Lentinula guzmanii TaxID=2804957 RepID=A0AA38N1N1_9AGAR|nr:hypothetical protein DFJ43DRAFT_1153786 [Lentinula guzmanii]
MADAEIAASGCRPWYGQLPACFLAACAYEDGYGSHGISPSSGLTPAVFACLTAFLSSSTVFLSSIVVAVIFFVISLVSSSKALTVSRIAALLFLSASIIPAIVSRWYSSALSFHDTSCSIFPMSTTLSQLALRVAMLPSLASAASRTSCVGRATKQSSPALRSLRFTAFVMRASTIISSLFDVSVTNSLFSLSF